MSAVAEAGHILITGGAGFIGSNLADRLATDGCRVVVLDALVRPGVAANIEWLRARHGGRIAVEVADVRDPGAVVRAVRGAGAVFHLAAQVAVTTSLAAPRADFETNVLGTLNVLEAVRECDPGIPLVFASTNKVYGDLADIALVSSPTGYRPADARLAAAGIGEERRLDFHTPYGCSKGAADQYVLDYSRSFGLRTTVLRMSCIYGPRQFGTEDQGWVAHFLIRMLEEGTITLYGDGEQVRDVLDVSDAVDAYCAAARQIDLVRGRAFNLGGGADNTVSLKSVLAHLAELLGRAPRIRHEEWRAGDQRYFVSDTGAIRSALGLPPPRPWRDGIARLALWLAETRGCAEAAARLRRLAGDGGMAA